MKTSVRCGAPADGCYVVACLRCCHAAARVALVGRMLLLTRLLHMRDMPMHDKPADPVQFPVAMPLPREMEAYDSDRYAGGSEGEGGGSKPAKGGRGGKASRAKPAGSRGRGARKPAGSRGKGGGAGKKAAAPAKREAPKPKASKAAGGGAAGGRKPAAKKARVSKAAAEAEASSGSDWDAGFE